MSDATLPGTDPAAAVAARSPARPVAVPATVSRDKVGRFLTDLGFKPGDVRSLMLEPLVVTVEVYVRDERGGIVTDNGYPRVEERHLGVTG